MAIDFKKIISENPYQEKTDDDLVNRVNSYFTQERAAKKKKKEEEEDIAPVKERNYWFEKGALSDGYDAGDITKTILGTAADIGLSVAKGVGGMLEGVNDWAWYRTADVAEALGADDFAKKAKGYGDKDSIDELLKPAEEFVRPYTAAGGLVQQTAGALGQVGSMMATGGLGVAAGLGRAGATLLTSGTMFASSAGSEESRAYKAGATEEEAKLSGVITGAADALSELMFGGLGKSLNIAGFNTGAFSADDLLAKKVSEKFSSQIAKNFSEYGIKATGEGLEEVVAGLVQSVGKKITYMDEEELGKIIEDEDLLNQFVVGAVTSGIVQSRGLIKSNKAGRDYITGLSEREQKVIDSEVGKRTVEKQKQAAVNKRVDEVIAQREKKFGTRTEEQKREIRQEVLAELDGGKLDYSAAEIDKKELAEIEKQVKEDFDRGFIDIDSIGDLYSPEKTAQIRELNTELSNTTDKAKKAELETKLNELKQSRLVELDSRLSDDVYLKESLKQEVLKGMDFTREVTDKDSDITKSLVESAKSVGMNNTRRMHDLFEYVDKIANHSKLKYEFTNTAELKANAGKLKLDEKGTRANGMVVTVDGETKVLINVDSDRALNFIVGHETGHVLESTNEYETLQKIAKQYAITKGEYDTRKQALEKLYEGTGANIENELTADLVGDYLFTDEQFVKELTAERNVFQKIYDYVKRAYKMATAGSQEKRQLEKVKRSFEKAYKELSKTTTQQTKDNLDTDADSSTAAKYSVTENMSEEERYQELKDKRLKVAEAKENEALDDQDWSGKSVDAIYDFIVENREAIGLKENYSHEDISFEFQFGNRRIKKSLNETLRTKQDLNDFKDLLSNFSEVIENAVLVEKHKEKNVDNKSSNLDAVYVFLSAYRKGNAITPVRLQVKELKGDGGRLYFAVTIEKSRVAVTTSPTGAVTTSIDSDISIAELVKNINPEAIDTLKYFPDNMLSEEQKAGKEKGLAKDREKYGNKYSLSDSQGRKLTKGQQEYFKDSKIRDENGQLKVMYHGTPAGDFTIFKDGTYFTENKEYADRYQSPSASSISSGKVATNPKTFEVYLDIKKPFDINDPEAREIYINDYIKGGNAMGINPYLSDAEYAKIQTIDWTEGEDLRDFLIEEGYDYDGLVLDEGADGGYGEDVQYRGKSYVVFSPNQIKDVNNANPTTDPDIRFSLSAPVEKSKNLMAIHNLHANELLKQLDLGGLPMPSVAITKPEIIEHEGFGEVTLILDRDAIDPKASKYNKVYGADAYTPTFPSVEYEINDEVLKRAHKILEDATQDAPEDVKRKVYRFYPYNDPEGMLNSHGGETGLIEWLEGDRDMKQTYLYTKGQYVDTIVSRQETVLPDVITEKYDFLIERLGNDVVNDAISAGLSGRQYFEKNAEAIKTAYADYLLADGVPQETVDAVIAVMKPMDFLKEVRGAARYLKNGPVTVKEEPDYKATNEEIDRRIDSKEYKKWLQDLFHGIEGTAGLRNDVDLFDRRGNRRSFKQLHDPITLDNIVKIMRGKAQQKGEAFLGSNMFGASAQEYKSIQDVKKDSGRLGILPEEEHKANEEYVSEKLEEIAQRYAGNESWWDARNALVEAVANSETRKGIEKYLHGYDYVYKLDDSIVDDLINLRDYVRSLPTPYFEAKPQRAVGLDEVGVYVIPNNADAELKRKLLEAGYSIAEYNPDIEGDRQKVVNQFEQYKFSLSNNLAPVGNYNVYRSDVLLPEAQTAPETPTIGDSPTVEDIAPVVIPEEKRYEEGRPLSEEELPYFEQERSWSFDNITEEDLPAEAEEEFYSVPDTAALDDKSLRLLAKNMKDELNLKPKQIKNMEKIIQDFSTTEDAGRETLYEMIEEEFGTIYEQNKIDEVVQVKKELRELRVKVSDTIKGDIPDYFKFMQSNFGKIRFSNQGLPVDDVYEGLKVLYPGYFPADIDNPTDQLLKMVEVANLDTVYTEEYFLPEEQIQDVTDFIYESVQEYKREMSMRAAHEMNLAPIDESMIPYEEKPKRELPPSNFDSHDFTESRGVQQEYDLETEEIVDDTHDIELERLEKRKAKALDDLGDLTSYTKQQAQTLYDEVRMMQKGKKVSADLGFILDRMFEGVDKKADNYEEVKDATYKRITDALLAIERSPAKPEKTVPPTESLIRNSIETKYGWRVSEIESMKLDSRAEARRKLRKELVGLNEEGLTKALDDAKNVPMMLMNNTDTIRNTELVFGRENGKLINEAIFQKEIDNEAKSIAWQNKERAEIKELGIKARSKESAAVQKYGEKQYVNEFGDLVKYGDDELAAEGFDVETQAKIRKAARIIREKYDSYIDLANETLTKLGFDPIKKRSDYMRHFQELNDVFSRYGIPFNAQAMQENDLPTDINGLTDSWSPQKNYFANMQPRKGERTTLDAITGIDGYIGGIANLIYHTEDIQRGRAFEEIIRETYGQEKGWENLEKLEGLSPEEYQARADKIQDNHLSNYAAWVHEWTNNIAGKKSKVDRSIESMFGRKAFALLDQVRKQVGSNMIGLNLSSSLTNLIAPVQAASKTKKLAVVKGTADTIKNIFVKDDFMEKNSFLTARMGTDMLSKTAWQKVQDAGYIFMKGMDWFSSNQIVRSKYYELLSKGMTEEQAHAEAGKFAARIMGDRTKGAQAQLYNSKLIGLVTQFQLEVNNQLYSMFYDTYHESKEAAKNNAAKTAAGMTFTLGQLAALTHVFGQTFESVAGYNPTFDIIGIIATALGAGDDDDEKTTSERLKEAADKLVDALPYVNIMTGGGRIPIASGIPNPIGVLTGGKDEYGNELTWGDEAKKLLYLIPPTGGNQAKKTYQGLSMFDEDLPVSGSYTDSGNLRFPVEDTPLNRIQAGLFGQWASGNANAYFDQERQPLKEKQIQEYKDLDIPIAEYWEYRDGLKGLKTVDEKFDYVAGLDLPVSKKNIMINNIVDRDEKVDLINYDDFGSYEEFDWATKNPEKYDFFQKNGISYKEYAASKDSKNAYGWAYENPEGYTVSKAVTKDLVEYRKIAGDLYDIKADKDENGKSISGSRKEKVADYINNLDADYGAKLILFKSEYPSYDDANMEIIDYLNNRQDISYGDMQTILTELGFTVDAEGNIYW